MEELWKPIKGYEGLYEVSNCGGAKSLANSKSRKEKILKPIKKSQGYVSVDLWKNGRQKTVTIHTLVWDAFGEKPRDGRKLQVDHIDGDKTNNKISNLQLLTQRQNTSKGKIRPHLPTGVYHQYTGKKKSGYTVRIMIKGEDVYLGYYTNIVEASLAYQRSLDNIISQN